MLIVIALLIATAATAEDRCGMPDQLERHPDERLLRARAEQQMPDDADARRSLPAGLERVFDYCVENNCQRR
jgi:hypothetical protein